MEAKLAETSEAQQSAEAAHATQKQAYETVLAEVSKLKG